MGPRINSQQNRFAYAGLFCGMASLVPLVILFSFIPAIAFSVIGLIQSTRLPGNTGRNAALIGILLAMAGLIIQGFVAGLSGLIGLLG